MNSENFPSDVEQAEKPPTVLTSEEKTWGMLCHLSAFLGYFAAGLTFVGPLICWLVKKDTSKFVDHHGKESLNFHLNVLGYNIVCIAGIFLSCGIGALLVLPVLAALHIYVMVIQIVAGIKAHSGEWFRYPAIVRLIT